jgi:hypothetical protein
MKNELNYGIRSLSLCEVLNAERPAPHELGRLDVNGVDFRVLQGTISLAMSREPKRNTRVSAALAMQIAERNPEMRVVYLNTYAGVELLQKSFRRGRNTPPQNTTPQPPPLSEEGEMTSGECVELQNLSIINIPFTEWDIDRLIGAIPRVESQQALVLFSTTSSWPVSRRGRSRRLCGT